MATKQIQRTNGSDLLPLEAAAERLDLTPSFLSWAVEGGFLQASRDAKGDWCLPAGEIEEGLRALQEERAIADKRRLETVRPIQEGAPSEIGGDGGSSARETGSHAFPDPAPNLSNRPAEAVSEQDYLRVLVKELQASIDAKDSLIADLARQMGRLSELSLARLPAPGSPDKTPRDQD